MIYFISGHLAISEAEFQEHYVPLLEAALAEPEASFVVGDCRGADQMAQRYLWGRTERVVVYHMFESPRANPGFPTVGGYQNDTARDAAMTDASDVDIAWIRPGKEKSGTARNLERRAKRKHA